MPANTPAAPVALARSPADILRGAPPVDLERAREMMARDGLDGLVVSLPINAYHFSGYWPATSRMGYVPNVTVLVSAQTTEVLGDGQKVVGLNYKDRVSGEINRVELEGIFVQIGLLPNTEFLNGTVALSPRGEILINDKGERIDEAGPSVPVEVLGLNGTPQAGDTLNVVETEAQAREIADYREKAARDKRAAAGAATTLEQLMAKAKADKKVSELPVVVKADVQGSAEAILQAMEKIGNEEVRVRVLHSGVGAITDSDVGLAEASGAPIIGFNVRANASARTSANQKGVEIRYYSVIYDLVDDVKAAASGLLKAEVRETFIGYATIKEVFKVSNVGNVAGCLVTEGVARRSAGVRLLRDNVVIHEGTLKTLKRFKDEVKEVQSGQECGMAFENYDNLRAGDVIEIFEREEVERKLA